MFILAKESRPNEQRGGASGLWLESQVEAGLCADQRAGEDAGRARVRRESTVLAASRESARVQALRHHSLTEESRQHQY